MDSSKIDVKKIASLAYLAIAEDELKNFEEQFSSILAYVDKLKELEISEIKETSNITQAENVFREDKETVFNNKDLLSLLPHKKNNYLEVKKILNNND